METALFHTKSPNLCPYLFNQIKPSSVPSKLNQPFHIPKHQRRTILSQSLACRGPAVSEVEAEMDGGEGDEWMEARRGKEKWQGKGVVEALECLEKEAIMGDDEGRDPNDYHRRAQIFDKSSRVFQALKEEDESKD